MKRKRLPKRRLCNKRGSIIMEAVRSRVKIAMSIKITLLQPLVAKVRLD